MRTKLLVLASTFPRWRGDSRPAFVWDLARGVSDRFDVTVLAPGAAGAADVECWDGVTIRRYRYGWPASTQKLADGAIMPNLRHNRVLAAQVPPFLASQLWAAWRLAERERFNVIHAHWVIPQGVVAALVRARLGTPVVVTAHGADVYALRSAPVAALKRRALASSDHVTAVSRSVAGELMRLGVPAGRLSVLPMGVDTVLFTPAAASDRVRARLSPRGGPALLFVGRLAEKKGAQYAIAAVAQVLRRHDDATLTVIGDGPQRTRLEVYAHRLGIAHSVQFWGAVPNADLPAVYASADVLLGPSVVEKGGDTESFGVVFAEAMASGCAVVVTDVGGVSDLVTSGETGVLVPQRSARDLAEAALRILGDPAMKSSMRSAARARVIERFDHRQIHAAYGDIFAACAGADVRTQESEIERRKAA
jgi:glycosyltransferase involved in cell wall biosynthesis